MKKILFTKCLIVFFTIFCGIVNGQNTLNVGDLVILAVNGDDDVTYRDGFSFLPLEDMRAGTIVYITDKLKILR